MDLIDRRQGRRSTHIQTLSWAPQRMYNRIYKSNFGRRVLRLVESQLKFLRSEHDPSVFFRVKDRGSALVSYAIDHAAGSIELAMDLTAQEQFFRAMQLVHGTE
jgi:hypothetical protein